MIKHIATLAFALSCFSLFSQTLHNGRYTLETGKDGSVSILGADGAQASFKPAFVYYYSEKKPRTSWEKIPVRGQTDNINYRVISWNKEQNVFAALSPTTLALKAVQPEKGCIRLAFEKRPEIQLEAVLCLPEDGSEPLLTYTFTALSDGCYSLGFTGAPEVTAPDEVWQPLIWTQKRFPGDCYVTADFNCPLPLAVASKDGSTYGLCVSPESFPYEPLPTNKNCRFGVSLRNPAGNAQAMVWAPLAGFPASMMKKGDRFCFSVRLICEKMTPMALQEQLALNLFGMKDYHRDNRIGSLNSTLDNMIDYGMSQYSWFISEYKGCSYETDVKGSVKNTSSLNPLNIAFVADRADIFHQRFFPVYEFLLSRENLLFSTHIITGEGGQKPSGKLGKPVIQASEAAVIYKTGGAASPFLITNIQKEKAMNAPRPNERYWKEQLEMWYATADNKYLDNAMAMADKYLQENIYTVQDKFDYRNQSSSSFWCQLAPKYTDLYNLWEASGEKRFLEAARYAAHRFAQYLWMSPAIPSGNITVNPGGKAPQQKHFGIPMEVPEESVPAWLVSEAGLHCECAATAGSHRGIFPAQHAAYLLRIAHDAEDPFLEKIANWAIVGRYTNFPGYHINTARSTVYQKPGFPLHTHYEMNVNSMHYNHVWPHMSIVLDYLVSQAETRSNGTIRFPAMFVEAFANLGCRIYGHEPGTWKGDRVILWMPQRLLTVSNPQINYVSARSPEGDKLYLAFSSESLREEWADVTVNDTLAKGSRRQFRIKLAPGGFSTLVLTGMHLDVRFQEQLLHALPAWKKDYVTDAYGRAMILNVGSTGKILYAYTAGDASSYKRVCLRYRIDGGAWTDRLDCVFPYEFSIPVGEDVRSLEYQFIMVDGNDAELKGEIHQLSKE